MIITIGRQLGSGGREIGQKLSKALNISYFDKEILALTAEKSGMSQKVFEQADEQTRKGVPAGLFGLRFPFLGDGTIASNGLSNEVLFKLQSDVMREIADKQSCIFIGRCADYILRDHKDCLNIFICAEDEDRIRRIIEYEKLSVEEARDKMDHIDKKRAAYYNYYTNKTWGVASSYHLCLNSSVLGIDETVKFIQSYAQAFNKKN